MKRPKVLAVDDELLILRIIKESLIEKYDVLVKDNAHDAIAAVIDERPDLIVFDNIMPGMSGLDAVRMIRRASSADKTPIILLTALKDSSDRVEAFKAGVDDFMSKPFRPEELLARVDSKIQRFSALKGFSDQETILGNLAIDPVNYSVKIRNQDVALTRIELLILHILVTRPNTLVSRSEISQSIWPENESNDRLIDIHMATLRKKLKHFDHRIETVYGKGYIIRSKPL